MARNLIPDINADLSELADYLELRCWLDPEKSYSIRSARSAIAIESDEICIEGVDDDEDRLLRRLDDALSEINMRKSRCNDKYPFIVDHNVVRLNEKVDPEVTYIYIYLLYATVCNMGRKRIAKGIDGSAIFESLCASVSYSYFGPNTETLVFGTSYSGSFKDKVANLLNRLQEGGVYREPFGSNEMQKDGKLDIVAWKPFHDKRGGKLIAMGQCKTGTSWSDQLTQLQPTIFFQSYSTTSPFAPPVRLFFIADSCTNSKWEENCRYAGILFDRNRIMDCISEIPDELLEKINLWSSGIEEQLNSEYN